jgi:hypothetical protein
MTDAPPNKLPPMGALEFAIAAVFRHFFFGLRMALMWAILLVPLLIVVWFAGFHGAAPDVTALKPEAIAGLAALAAAVVIASVSIAVNWHRRVILGESPTGFGWVRLNGVVWKYLLGFVVVWIVLAIIIAGAAASAMLLPAALAGRLGQAAQPAGIGLAALLGLLALLCWYRLSTWLPAIAVADRDYSLARAWRATRGNTLAFLGFTFWLVFTLAIAGGIGAGAFLGQQALGNPWATAAAFAFAGILGWLCLFLVTTVATAHYCVFSGRGEFAE